MEHICPVSISLFLAYNSFLILNKERDNNMSEIMYLNGEYLPEKNAKISFLDRGFQFSDGVYDVIAIHLGRPVLLDDHLDRLYRSLDIISLPLSMEKKDWRSIIYEVMNHNSIKPGRVEEGWIYLQVTRGAAPRNRVFPDFIIPTIAVTAKPYDFPIRYNPLTNQYGGSKIQGVTAITTQDQRWKRSDLKSLALLPSVLAAQIAFEANAFEALLVGDDGLINEGTVSNVWIVDRKGTLITPPESHRILPGIVRRNLIKFAQELNIPLNERHFSVEEAYNAGELFLSGTRTKILPVVKLDGKLIESGKPGEITLRLLRSFWKSIYHGKWF